MTTTAVGHGWINCGTRHVFTFPPSVAVPLAQLYLAHLMTFNGVTGCTALVCNTLLLVPQTTTSSYPVARKGMQSRSVAQFLHTVVMLLVATNTGRWRVAICNGKERLTFWVSSGNKESTFALSLCLLHSLSNPGLSCCRWLVTWRWPSLEERANTPSILRWLAPPDGLQ